MNYHFLRAFRHNIRQARHARDAQFYRLSAQVRCQIGKDLFVSHIREPGYEYSRVWTVTPRMGYVRVISDWYCLSAACRSAERIARRRMQEGVRT